MGFFGDVWDGIKSAPDQLADLGQGAVEGAGNFIDWLGDSSGGPKSNVAAADRANFITPGGEDRTNRLNALADQYGNRTAPQAADSSFRGDQASLVERLRNQMGGADSLAQLQLRNATDQNIAQQRSLAASANPQNAAMMQRLAAQNIGKMNQGLGQQAAQLGIQERNAAANALAGVAGQARGQDLQHNQFNTQAQLQQTGLNDQASIATRGQELANAGMRQQGNMGYESNQTMRRGQDLGVPQQPANWERVVGAAGAVAPFLLADGGMVTEPTDAVVGEAGPEAIIPLAQLPGLVNSNANRVTGLESLRLLGEGKDDKDRTSARDYAIQMSQASDDPLVRGLGGIAGAWAHRQDKQKEGAALRSSLADQAGPRPQASRLSAQLGGGMMGATLAPYAERGASAELMNPYTMMAKGGVVTEPTRAVIGEDGPEVVVPLDQLPTLMERLGAIGGGRTKQTAKAAPAPAPQSASLFARPEELSRQHFMVRPEELYRERPAPRPAMQPVTHTGALYMHRPPPSWGR